MDSSTHHSFTLTNPVLYIVLVLIFALLVRVIMVSLRSVKMTFEDKPRFTLSDYGANFRRNFSGYCRDHRDGSKYSDFWYTFVLGVLELSAFPILMGLNAWTAIGGWIGLKALAQWKVWGDDRAIFNLFLIGCALNVLASLLIWAAISEGGVSLSSVKIG